jgi:hypothetical protein
MGGIGTRSYTFFPVARTPTTLNSEGWLASPRLLGPKVAPGVCEQLDHSLNLSTGSANLAKTPHPCPQ